MNLGFLGLDSRMLAVAAAARRRGDQIVLVADVPADAFPGVATADRDAFLDPASCDAVVVGSDGWSESRGAAVRSLVQAGRPLLVSQPLELSMLWAWELEMIRRDVGGLIVPLLPERRHPFIGRLRGRLESALGGGGAHGEVESLVLERQRAGRSRAAVLAALARDADLIRVLTGDPGRLSAIGAVPDDELSGWQSLVVGLSGPVSVPVRWEVSSAGDAGLRLTLRCDRGPTSLWIPDAWDEPWVWSEPDRPEERAIFPAADAMLDLLAAGGREVAEADGVPPAVWADAARAIELADTVPRSLVKGRAIDLHQEEFSDLGTFRGTMASLGCGLLLAALVLVVVAALVGGLANEFGWGFGDRLAGTWPVVALVVLGGFLLLQILPLLVGRGREHE